MEDPKEQIRKFLKEFKYLTSIKKTYIVKRYDNQKSFIELGITEENCRDELITLSLTDYSSGPEPDKDRSGSIWIFGKHIGNREVYIKLKIFQVGNESRAKCIAFHPASAPLSYPYRTTSKEEE